MKNILYIIKCHKKIEKKWNILFNIIGYLYIEISKTAEPFYKIPGFIIGTIISFILIGFIIYSISFYNKLKKAQVQED